jgi:drug/metabolite transporter (DMT)-like permease
MSAAPVTQPAPAWIGEFVLLAALWGASFLFMRMGAQSLAPAHGRAARGCWPRCSCGPSCCTRASGRAAPALEAGAAVGAGQFGHSVCAVFLGGAAHHHGLASILNATVPLFGALVAWVWLGDRINRLRWLGLAHWFCRGGAAGLARAGGGGHQVDYAPWAIAACLGATTCYAIAASYARRYLVGVPPLATATGSQLGAALGLLVPMLWFWPATMPGLRAWAAIVAIAVLCTGIAYILYFRLIAHAGPSRALAVTFWRRCLPCSTAPCS